MNDSEWSTSRDPRLMLLKFADNPDRPELRLFGCACCRRIWNLVTDETLRRSVEVREQFERGLASATEIEEAELGARYARREVRGSIDPSNVDEESPESAVAWAAGAASNATHGNYRAASELAARAHACAAGGDWQRNYDAERAAQAALLRSMVRPPVE